MRFAIASATALLPLAVGPKIPRTAGSGGCGDELGTAERRRCGRTDLDRDNVAGGRRAGEVHRRVPPCSTAQDARIRAAGALDENVLDAPDALGVPRSRPLLHDLDQPLDPLAL